MKINPKKTELYGFMFVSTNAAIRSSEPSETPRTPVVTPRVRSVKPVSTPRQSTGTPRPGSVMASRSQSRAESRSGRESQAIGG